MNFWQAYTSKQPFRRRHWDSWFRPGSLDIRSDRGVPFMLNTENLNAEDYEIMPRDLEILVRELAKIFETQQP